MLITKNHFVKTLILFIGSGAFFFYKSVSNTKGLIINSIFHLNVAQANIFYGLLGCLCIFILAMCGVAVHLQNKRLKSM